MSRAALKILFVIWLAVWAFFLARELALKGRAVEYGRLLSLSLEGKRSYVTGDRLYEFISFCGKNLPPEAGYKIIGIEEDSVDRRRAAYYLYPNIEMPDAGFVLVFDAPYERRRGEAIFKRLDAGRYIIERPRVK